MVPNNELITKPFSQSLLSRHLSSFANDFRSMVNECSRTVPFSTPGMVANVSLLSTLGMLALTRGMLSESFTILSTIHKFLNGKVTWSRFGNTCDSFQRHFDVPDTVWRTVISYLTENAGYIVNGVQQIPGDLLAPHLDLTDLDALHPFPAPGEH